MRELWRAGDGESLEIPKHGYSYYFARSRAALIVARQADANVAVSFVATAIQATRRSSSMASCALAQQTTIWPAVTAEAAPVHGHGRFC